MGKRRRKGTFSLQKSNNSIEDLVGNEENEHAVPDTNKTKINITNELNDVHKKKNLSHRKSWMNSVRYL
jgi:hypothetical protein